MYPACYLGVWLEGCVGRTCFISPPKSTIHLVAAHTVVEVHAVQHAMLRISVASEAHRHPRECMWGVVGSGWARVFLSEPLQALVIAPAGPTHDGHTYKHPGLSNIRSHVVLLAQLALAAATVPIPCDIAIAIAIVFAVTA